MYIAIDLGGTNLRIASFDKDKILDIVKFKVLGTYKEDLELINQNIKKICKEPRGIGFSSPGRFNKEKTIRISKGNLPGWHNATIVEDLTNAFNCPVYLENDAACAALGEAYYGSGIGKSFLYIIWGTGVGGTEVKNINGKVTYTPIEPGHDIILKKNGREGTCGHKGCLESYVGGGSVLKHYGKQMTDLSDEELNEITDKFTLGIVKLLEERSAEIIIFGGGAAINLPNAVKDIERKVEGPKMVISHLGDNAGLYGALALIKMNQDSSIPTGQ